MTLALACLTPTGVSSASLRRTRTATQQPWMAPCSGNSPVDMSGAEFYAALSSQGVLELQENIAFRDIADKTTEAKAKVLILKEYYVSTAHVFVFY